VEERDSLPHCLPNRPEVLRSLDVVILHDLVMEESSGQTYQKDKDLIYTRDLVERHHDGEKRPSMGGFHAVFFRRGVLATVAEAGEVMPPKTTYFIRRFRRVYADARSSEARMTWLDGSLILILVIFLAAGARLGSVWTGALMAGGFFGSFLGDTYAPLLAVYFASFPHGVWAAYAALYLGA